jgi:hypothetical protein
MTDQIAALRAAVTASATQTSRIGGLERHNLGPAGIGQADPCRQAQGHR